MKSTISFSSFRERLYNKRFWIIPCLVIVVLSANLIFRFGHISFISFVSILLVCLASSVSVWHANQNNTIIHFASLSYFLLVIFLTTQQDMLLWFYDAVLVPAISILSSVWQVCVALWNIILEILKVLFDTVVVLVTFIGALLVSSVKGAIVRIFTITQLKNIAAWAYKAIDRFQQFVDSAVVWLKSQLRRGLQWAGQKNIFHLVFCGIPYLIFIIIIIFFLLFAVGLKVMVMHKIGEIALEKVFLKIFNFFIPSHKAKRWFQKKVYLPLAKRRRERRKKQEDATRQIEEYISRQGV